MRTLGAFAGRLLLLGVLALWAAVPTEAAARRRGAEGGSRHGEPAAQAQAEKLRAAGAAALAEHKLDVARQALDDSYARFPAAQTLYYLGQLALAEGQVLEAQDLLRRFVRELGAAVEPQQQKEAARIAALASQPFGELEILGARDALVRVDGRLRGVLPLALPILLPSGPHEVALHLGARRLASPVEIQTGRTAQLRFDLQTGVAVVTLPPTILLVQDYGTFPPAVQDALASAAEQAVRAEQHAALHPRPALVRAPELVGCVRTRSCQVQLMRRNEVEYAIALSLLVPLVGPPAAAGALPGPTTNPTANPAATPPAAAAPPILHGELLDSVMGEDVALALNQPIELANPAQAAATATEFVTRLLKEGRARPRGTLAVNTTPPGAAVFVSGGQIGTTPYEHPAWAGSYDVIVQKTGYNPAQLRASVEADKKESLQAILEPLPGPPPRRPLWRTVTGAIAIGLGGTLILTSTSSLFSSDSSQVATGAAVVTLGSLVTVGGVLLLTLPVTRSKPKSAAQQVH